MKETISQGGIANSGGGPGRREGSSKEKAHKFLGGCREEMGEGSGCTCLLPPLPTVQGTSTQPMGQVCIGLALTRRREEQERIIKTYRIPFRTHFFLPCFGGSLHYHYL
jgi:hypothetical protein